MGLPERIDETMFTTVVVSSAFHKHRGASGNCCRNGQRASRISVTFEHWVRDFVNASKTKNYWQQILAGRWWRGSVMMDFGE